MQYKHPCIKCTNVYESNDEDAYYCPSCNEERLRLAREVDLKMAGRVSKRSGMSDLQAFDAIRAAKGVNFVNIRDLGITL